MEGLTAYARIAQKIDEQEPHTAPKADDGNIHPAFIHLLKLLYSPEEAGLLQHLDVLATLASAEDVARTSGNSLEYVTEILERSHSRNSIMGLGSMYCLPPIPLLINHHNFYPETTDGDLEAADLYQEYFDEMVELGPVGHTLNAELGDRLICLCCGCNCSQTRGRLEWDDPDALAPSNFAPQPGEDCIGCETCADRCLFGALSLDEETDQIQVDIDKCIGCGVCTLACPQETLKPHRHERSSIAFETPGKLDEAMARENRE